MRLSLATLATLTTLAACSAPGGGGRSEPLDVPRGDEPMTDESAIVIRSAGLDALLDDPRDEGLRRALSMVRPRLLELPEELGEEGPPPFAIEWVLDVLASPMSLAVDLDPEGDWAAGPPVQARLVVEGRDAAHAQALAADFEQLLGFALPVPGDRHPSRPGLRVVQTPAGGLAYGTPEGSKRFVVSWGDGDDGPLGLGSLDLPEGVEPLLAFKLDMARITPAVEMALGMAGPEGDDARRQLEAFGLLGDEPLMVTAAMGHGDGNSRCAVRYANWVPMARELGMLPGETLTAADLAQVPADATYASVSKIDLGYVLKMMRTMAVSAEDFDPLDLIESFLGIDLERDVLDHMGTTVGLYLSDTTGGGGLLSAVLFMAVEDEAGLAGTIDHLAGALDGVGATEADGRVRVHEWRHDGVECTSLIFPGLPIPLEPSMAIADGWILKAATPQALMAALDRIHSGAPGLLAAPGIGLSSAEGLFSVSYTDTERLLPDGYGYSALLFSALGNALRSVSDLDRDPGPILPSYPELAEGVGPAVLVSRIEGDDLVVFGRGERSATVQVTALLGSPLAKVIGAAVAAGVAVPLVMKAENLERQTHHAREQARAAEVRARELQEALESDADAHEHDDGHDHDHDHDHDHEDGR